MGWTGRAPAPNRSENVRGLEARGARLANVPRCLIGIEAGMATHYVARELSALGHDVKQVPRAYAKPFRQGHKNDFRDASWTVLAQGRSYEPRVESGLA
jgi:transposase